MSRSYVYRRVVTKWPDWCSKYGWADAYTDTPDWFGHDPYDEDPRPPVPKELKDMLDADENLVTMLEAERSTTPPHLWEQVKMPTVRRRQWLSRSPAKKWVTTAVALGAEARIEKGWVIWEDELNENLAKVKEGL